MFLHAGMFPTPSVPYADMNAEYKTKLSRHIHQHEWHVYEHPNPLWLFAYNHQIVLAKETLIEVFLDNH